MLSLFRKSRKLGKLATSILRSGLGAMKPAFGFAKGGGYIMGIDLGTTNSCVAIMEGDEPKVI